MSEPQPKYYVTFIPNHVTKYAEIQCNILYKNTLEKHFENDAMLHCLILCCRQRIRHLVSLALVTQLDNLSSQNLAINKSFFPQYKWKGSNSKRSARWQYISWLNDSALSILLNKLWLFKTQQLLLGTGTALWWLTEPHYFNVFTVKLNVSALNLQSFIFLQIITTKRGLFVAAFLQIKLNYFFVLLGFSMKLTHSSQVQN
jgi:hypothetical protein